MRLAAAPLTDVSAISLFEYFTVEINVAEASQPVPTRPRQ